MSELSDRVAEWWMRNARIRHGHPPEVTHRVDSGQAEATENQPPSAKANGASKSLLSRLPGAATAAIALSTGALGLSALPYLTDRGDNANADSAQTIIVQPNDGSLYQYLEDNGFHLADPSPNP